MKQWSVTVQLGLRSGEQVKVRFENTMKDLVALGRYHYEHSPTIQRSKAWLRWGLATLILAFTAAVAYAANDPVFIPVIGLALAAVYFYRFPGEYQRPIDRSVRRMYKEGSNKGILGSHELELIGDELVERTPFNESRMSLQAIERVVSDGDYTFIYISAVMAHVIPHKAVTEGDREAFIEAIRKRVSENSASQNPLPQ